MQTHEKSPVKKTLLTIKRNEITKLNKALNQLEKDAQKKQATADVITLAHWVELKYDILEKLKPVDIVAMLKNSFNLNVTTATLRNYLKAEKMKRETTKPNATHTAPQTKGEAA